jgi:hypothetical protein
MPKKRQAERAKLPPMPLSALSTMKKLMARASSRPENRPDIRRKQRVASSRDDRHVDSRRDILDRRDVRWSIRKDGTQLNCMVFESMTRLSRSSEHT